jgi:oligoendopeptidase F
VHQHLPLLHRLVALRGRVLGIQDYALWDNLIAMVKPASSNISYDQACTWVTDAVAPLGDEYQSRLKKAFSERWIDVYYTPGKRSGAYSGGMYQTKPYILLNHKNNLNSAFTLAHELGHSLHSYYSCKGQVYAKSSYPIFLAEVASTTNEMLLHFYLMDQAKAMTGEKAKEMELYLLDHLFTQFRSTLYRQVQFAEYERDIHAMAEEGRPLTADSLSLHYSNINQKYYGSGVKHDPAIDIEWARIPHFYYNFYVYKYATSFAAAQYFARKIYDGDQAVKASYLKFLQSGCSQDPLDTLIDAGLDLRDTKPIEAAFRVFSDALTRFEQIKTP